MCTHLQLTAIKYLLYSVVVAAKQLSQSTYIVNKNGNYKDTNYVNSIP